MYTYMILIYVHENLSNAQNALDPFRRHPVENSHNSGKLEKKCQKTLKNAFHLCKASIPKYIFSYQSLYYAHFG